MGECDRVKELNLNQRVLGIYVEIDVDHHIENDDEAEDNQVRAHTLNLADDVH